MIHIEKILKRSWQILWGYRVLWIFGFLLALTTGSSSGSGTSSYRTSTGSNGSGGFNGGIPDNAPEWMRNWYQWFLNNVQPLIVHPEQHITTFVWIGVIIFVVVLLLSLLFALVRYPTETAIIRMVDAYEQTGSKLSFRQGWKLGWTRRAFRMWLIDVLISLPIFVLVLVLFGAGAILFSGLMLGSQPVMAFGVLVAVGLGLLTIFLLTLVGVLVGLLRNFFIRAAALDGLGTLASLRYGWALFWRNWKSAGLMWLVMIAVGIAMGIVGLITFFIFIPLYFILAIPAALIAGLPAVIAFGITSIFASGPLAWIIAAVVAIPFFFTILFAPLVFVGGLYKVYESNVWTLTYREVKALDGLARTETRPLEQSL